MKRCGPKVQPGSHIHILGSAKECEGMNPRWELESLWNPECLKRNFMGQNSLDWKVPYTIEKFLRCRYLKWVCMTHLSIYNISYGWKKNWKSKCQFDSWPLKVGNRPYLCAYRWRATYRWKVFNESYNFVLNFTLIESLHKKLWACKVVRVLISRILGLLTWES